jgi:hypothetical protein
MSASSRRQRRFIGRFRSRSCVSAVRTQDVTSRTGTMIL